PVAVAAYEHAINNGKTAAEAITYANHIVRKTFTSKHIINAAPLLRDQGFAGTAVTFFGFLNGVAYQRARLIFEPMLREKTLAGKVKAAFTVQVAGQLFGFITFYQHF